MVPRVCWSQEQDQGETGEAPHLQSLQEHDYSSLSVAKSVCYYCHQEYREIWRDQTPLLTGTAVSEAFLKLMWNYKKI